MTAQNPRRDDRTLVRQLTELERRIKSLETAPRAGHTSISNGKLLVMDPATGNVIASLAGASGTDAYGNAYSAGLGANVGSVNGGVVQPGTIDATKVSFIARDISGVTTTTSATAPASPVVGDLWIDTANGNLLKRWDGASWVALPVGTNAIQAGSVTASQIAANTITAGQIAAGAITAASIAAGAIDGTTISGATIRTVTNAGGFFAYSGTPTLGNLIVSIASAAGTDDFGNAYPQGLDVNQGAISGSQITIEPGAGNGIFVYGTVPTVTTFNSGSGNWTAPAGVTSVKVEAWGAGGGGGDYASSQSGGGGGGGEYAAEATLAVTPGNSYAYSIGAGGAAGTGGGSGFSGTSSTFGGTLVVAHGGGGGANIGNGGTSGSGSTNTTHFNGANGRDGGDGVIAPATLGGAGGGSGGYTSAGNAPTGFSNPDVPLAAVTGGSAGGGGGTTTKAGTAGGAPGGGGGGAGSQGIAGAGSNGRVTVTYTPARTLLASLAGASGTDPYGNAYPAGISGSSLTLGGTDITGAWQTYTPTWTSGGTNPTLGNGTISGRYMRIGKTCHVTIAIVAGSTGFSAGTGTYLFSLPFATANVSGVGYLGTARFNASGTIYIGQVTVAANSSQINATFPTNSTTTTATNMSATVPVNPPPPSASLTMCLTYQTA